MDQNPICAEGYKNIFCPYYSDCLDHAVEHWWDYWACLECQHKNKQVPVTYVLLSPERNYSYYSLSPLLAKASENFS